VSFNLTVHEPSKKPTNAATGEQQQQQTSEMSRVVVVRRRRAHPLDADHPVPRSIVFLSIHRRRSHTPSSSSPSPSPSSRARVQSHITRAVTHAPSEETTRSRARRTVGLDDTAMPSQRGDVWGFEGIRLTVHDSRNESM